MKKKKNWLKIIIVFAIILLAIFGIYKLCTRGKESNNVGYIETLEDGTKRNTSEKLKETYTVNGIQINNMELTENTDGTIVFSAIAKNVITEKIDIYMLQVKFLNENQEEIGNTFMSVMNLESNDTCSINGVVENIDISKVYSAEIVKLEAAQ